VIKLGLRHPRRKDRKKLKKERKNGNIGFRDASGRMDVARWKFKPNSASLILQAQIAKSTLQIWAA